MASNFSCRWLRVVVAVVVSASFIVLPGCGGSSSTKVTMPNKTYDPLPPSEHKDLGGGGGPKRSLNK